MKIGFDARPLVFTRAGIASYLYGLVTAMASSSKDDLYLFSSTDNPMRLSARFSNIRDVAVRLPNFGIPFEKFWQDRMLPNAVNKTRIDIFHGPRFFVPGGLNCRSVVTVHDIAFKKFPDLVRKKVSDYFDGMLSQALLRSTRVITPSESTRADLVNIYNVAEEKITVIHEGADAVFSPGKDMPKTEKIKAKFSIKGKFMLFSGTIEPRKNLAGLLDAFKIIKSRHDICLVIAGGLGWLYEDVIKKAEDPELKGRVIFTGYVTAEDLAHLYGSCELFVFPSLYEGFGLPVLEAMACGAPVITSDNASLRELFSDSSYQVDPANIEAIADGIDKVLSDQGLRDSLKAKSLAKAGQFSWNLAAERTMELYRQVLS